MHTSAYLFPPRLEFSRPNSFYLSLLRVFCRQLYSNTIKSTVSANLTETVLSLMIYDRMPYSLLKCGFEQNLSIFQKFCRIATGKQEQQQGQTAATRLAVLQFDIRAFVHAKKLCHLSLRQFLRFSRQVQFTAESRLQKLCVLRPNSHNKTLFLFHINFILYDYRGKV